MKARSIGRCPMTGRALMLVLLLPVLAACGKGGGGYTDPETGERMFGSSVTPMDHDPSDTFVRMTIINGKWVGSAGTGGSTVLSGISLPVRWRPGLTAEVKWERCEPYGKNCQWHEVVAPIHQYDEVGRTWVHVMPGDQEVLIIPSMLAPDHPDYPGPGYPEKNFHTREGIK